MPNCACATPPPKKFCWKSPLLKAIEARNAVAIDAVLKQLNQLRGQAAQARPLPRHRPQNPLPRHRGTPAPNRRRNRSRSAPPQATRRRSPAATAPAAPVAAAPPVSADLAELWTKLVEAVGRVSPFTRSYLVDAIRFRS